MTRTAMDTTTADGRAAGGSAAGTATADGTTAHGPAASRGGTMAGGPAAGGTMAGGPGAADEPSLTVADRVDRLAWPHLADELDQLGCASTDPIVSPADCRSIGDLYDEPGLFRSTVDMARHRFGAGQYRYFDRPLPEAVGGLRAAFWPHLVDIARDWAERLGRPAPWPDALDDWLDRCHDAGQTRSTPLLLSYGPGDWNALHRDLYGDLIFPLQVVIGLSEPGADHTGGEFVMVEQRPRAQSRATSTVVGQGQALVFTTSDRPVRSARGWSAAPMRHGVSVVRTGHRRTLGLVFHDAR